jgi:hypothetical protein
VKRLPLGGYNIITWYQVEEGILWTYLKYHGLPYYLSSVAPFNQREAMTYLLTEWLFYASKK